MFSVSLPMEVVVLNDCVTETKGDLVPVEHLDQLGEVHQRARQAIDLVDDHHVHHPVLDVGQEPLRAGRSSVPPESPPSSYWSRISTQPSDFWLAT